MPLNCGVGDDSWECLGLQEDQLVNLKGNQPWILIGRIDAEAEMPVFWSFDANVDSLVKSLVMAKIESRRRRGHQRIRWLEGITDAMDITWANFGKWSRTGKAGLLQSIGLHRVGHDWRLNNNVLTCHSSLYRDDRQGYNLSFFVLYIPLYSFWNKFRINFIYFFLYF